MGDITNTVCDRFQEPFYTAASEGTSEHLTAVTEVRVKLALPKLANV